MTDLAKYSDYIDWIETNAEIQCLWIGHYSKLLAKQYPYFGHGSLDETKHKDIERVSPKIRFYIVGFLAAVSRFEALKAAVRVKEPTGDALAEKVGETYAHFTETLLGESVTKFSVGLSKTFVRQLQHKDKAGKTLSLPTIAAYVIADQEDLLPFSTPRNIGFLGECLDMFAQFNQRLQKYSN